MFKKNIRILAACLLLFLATGWGIYGSKTNIKQSQLQSAADPQTIISPAQSLTTPAPEIKIAAPTPPQTAPAQPLPPPIILQPPPPPPITAWQGDAQPVSSDPAQIPVLSKVPTDKPVVFLGIDDGLVKSPEAQSWLISHKLPFTLFLVDDLVKNDYDYFRSFQNAGMTIEDHTITHADLATLNLDQQKAEICGGADKFQTAFGNRPTLFRPPYGSYNEITKQAAADCGMKALIIWHAKANGGSIQFQDGNTHFLPGDIVLMHFRPEFMQDMKAFTDQVQNDHMQVGRLEDWIQ
jgi:peptidoglycan-N-acetylglucosamine deacetylase